MPSFQLDSRTYNGGRTPRDTEGHRATGAPPPTAALGATRVAADSREQRERLLALRLRPLQRSLGMRRRDGRHWRETARRMTNLTLILWTAVAAVGALLVLSLVR